MFNASRVAVAKLLGVYSRHDLKFPAVLSWLLPLVIKDSIC